MARKRESIDGLVCQHCGGDLNGGWEYYGDYRAIPDYLEIGFCSDECMSDFGDAASVDDLEEAWCNALYIDALASNELSDEFLDVYDDLEESATFNTWGW